MSGRARKRSSTGEQLDPANAIAWCHEAVQDVSRTFAITIDVLDEPMASYICVGYLLCRIADTVEDARHIPPDRQSAILSLYDRVLDPNDDADADRFMEAVSPWIPPRSERSSDWAVVAQTPRVIRAFDEQPDSVRSAMLPPVRELVHGMSLFVDRYAHCGGLRIQTPGELEEYCYYAAGTVGELITNLICRDGVPDSTRRRLDATAESFGQMLQLVNISKDVYTDFTTENNVYLPARWLRNEGVSPDAIDEAENVDRVATVIDRTANLARSYLDDAQTYLEVLPEREGNRVAAWAIPYLLAVGTLRELTARPEDAVSGNGVKVTRSEVLAIVSTAVSDLERDSIGTLRNTIARQPFHEA